MSTDPTIESNGGERRRFLRACGCALAGLTVAGVAPLLGGCEFSQVSAAPETTPGTGGKTVEIDVSSLTADGTGIMTDKRGPDRKKIFVVRIAEGQYKALSTECPHSGFPVELAGEVLFCTGGQGHGSTFTLEGTAIQGPALPFVRLRSYPSRYESARRVLVVTIG